VLDLRNYWRSAHRPSVGTIYQAVASGMMALEQNAFRTDSYSDSILAYKNFSAHVYDLVLLDIKKKAFSYIRK
jgi:hypothetical protein